MAVEEFPVNLLSYQPGGLCLPGEKTWGNMLTSATPWEASVGCVDWQASQWQASFKDVPFAVDTDTKSGGRRIHVHEYPSRDYWDNEDLGRLRQQVDVAGYVFGDKCELWAEELFAACTTPNEGLLYLPMRVPVAAHCLRVESTFASEQMGRIDFSLSFSLETLLPKGNQFPPKVFTATMFKQLVNTAASEVENASRVAFEDAFTGMQPAPARTEAVLMVRQAANLLRFASRATRLDAITGSLIEFQAKKLETLATKLVDKQRTAANVLTSTAGVEAQRMALTGSGLIRTDASLRSGVMRTSTGQIIETPGAPDEGFGGTFQKSLSMLSQGAMNPSDIAYALFRMTQLKPDEDRIKKQSAISAASVKAELLLANTVASLVRRLALAQSMRAAMKVAPAKQPDAIIKRKELMDFIAEEVAASSSQNFVFESLRRLRSAVITFVSFYSAGGGATIPVPQSMMGKPLAAIAADIYGKTNDIDRDLMIMNRIEHPLFPPSVLVAQTPPKGSPYAEAMTSVRDSR